MDYPLTGSDMLKNSAVPAKLVIYKDIHKYKNLDELFGDVDTIYLLYESQPYSGHWVTLFRVGDRVELFDSYNYKPDQQFNFINDDFKKQRNMHFPFLTKLLLSHAENGGEVHYNHHKLQRESSNIATCGRHGLVRVMFRDLPIDEYYQVMKQLKNKLSARSFDEVVLKLTSDIKKQ